MEKDRPNLCAIILTAGYSSRMGSFKPLLTIGEKTAIEHVIDTLRGAGISEIIAVTGYRRETLEPLLQEKQVTAVYNENFQEGMFTSIQKGIQAARSDMSGYLLSLVDAPLIPGEVIGQLIKEHRHHPEHFLVPCYYGKKGHPLCIPSCYREEILSSHGEGGLKAITSRHEDKMIKLEVKQEAVVLDMDTQEGYQEILDYYERQKCRGSIPLDEDDSASWQKLLGARRLFLVRHGETRQHKEKILLGQKDIPLSEKGIEQAKTAGLELKELGVQIDRIYTSDLSRAVQTAECIADTIGTRLIKEPGLRELSLGDWDGCYLSQLKELYPEEFKKRGEQRLTYKYGNNSENYYDLQYRVMKRLRTIMEEDSGEDLVIVAHTGVIQVIRSNMNQTSLDEEIKNKIPNGGITMLFSQKGNDHTITNQQ